MDEWAARLREIEDKWAVVEPVFNALTRGDSRLRGVWLDDPFRLTADDMHVLLTLARAAVTTTEATDAAGSAT